MKYLWLILVCLVTGQNLYAQLLAKDFIDGGAFGTKYVYRYLTPLSFDTKRKYPLVVFLHGAGEKGTNNTAQIDGQHAWAKRFTMTAVREQYPAFLIAPQLKDGNHVSSEIIALINSFKTKFNVDTNRIYLTGMSLGGLGTWETAQRNPNFFAAIAPICGFLSYKDSAMAQPAPFGTPLSVTQAEAVLKKIKSIPTWAFHSDDDPTVPVGWTRNIIAAERNLDASPIYSEYTGYGHFSWNPAYEEPKLLDWMFSQSKEGGESPVSPLGMVVAVSTNSAKITWSAPSQSSNEVMHYHVYQGNTRLTTGIGDLVGADGSGLGKLLILTTYTDNTWKSGDESNYKITAVNYRGQESPIGNVPVRIVSVPHIHQSNGEYGVSGKIITGKRYQSVRY